MPHPSLYLVFNVFVQKRKMRHYRAISYKLAVFSWKKTQQVNTQIAVFCVNGHLLRQTGKILQKEMVNIFWKNFQRDYQYV